MRARNLKPGFFSNEQLAEVSFAARILFAGLWCMADREGRLEHRPKRIKMQVFPADTLEVEPLIDELQDQTLVLMYEVSGSTYLWIPGFAKHQRPHPKESASTLPPYPDEKACSDGSGQGSLLTPMEGGGNPSDILNPSSLNPDVLNPPSGRARERARPSKRCPADFEVTAEMRAWAAAKFPAVDVDAQTEAMRDHEYRTPRSDWPATWRTWIRNAVNFGGAPKNGAGSTDPPKRKTRYDQAKEALERATTTD